MNAAIFPLTGDPMHYGHMEILREHQEFLTRYISHWESTLKKKESTFSQKRKESSLQKCS